MNGSYFAIECGEQFADHVVLMGKDGNVWPSEIMNMSADEFDAYDMKDEFISEAFLASHELFEDASEIAITLIDDEDCFVWSVIITDLGEDIEYELVDWCKDGKKFKYADD